MATAVGRSGLTISGTGFPRKELTRKELESLPSVGVPRNPLRLDVFFLDRTYCTFNLI
jgi:hypothetical protein